MAVSHDILISVWWGIIYQYAMGPILAAWADIAVWLDPAGTSPRYNRLDNRIGPILRQSLCKLHWAWYNLSQHHQVGIMNSVVVFVWLPFLYLIVHVCSSCPFACIRTLYLAWCSSWALVLIRPDNVKPMYMYYHLYFSIVPLNICIHPRFLTYHKQLGSLLLGCHSAL